MDESLRGMMRKRIEVKKARSLEYKKCNLLGGNSSRVV
jgi:hypothetical protein